MTRVTQSESGVSAVFDDHVKGIDGGGEILRGGWRLTADRGDRCRLLYLVGQLGAGGLERQLYYLMLAMDRERYQPAVVVWNYRDDNVYVRRFLTLGVPCYSLGEKSRYAKLGTLRRLVRALKPEVLHSYSFYTNFAAWWGTLGSTTIPVGSIRNNFLSDRRLAGAVLGRLSSRWPANQICNSVGAKTAVDTFPGTFKPSRLHVVTNRLDISRFHPAARLPEQPVMLAVGRLYPEKRWDRLVDVLAVLEAQGIACTVRHVGDGPLRTELTVQARRLGVDHLIEFLGTRHDVPDLLAESSFLVHTAEEEGCPNVVMEAMASGRAVIATDAGDVPLLVEDQKTGFVVARGDGSMLAARMAALIEDSNLCHRMGQAGRVKAEEEFGLCKLVEHTFRAYGASGWRR